jgi:uncharacterized protein
VTAELFVDTSGWFPLADPRDPDHATVAGALRARIASGDRLVTTNLVIAETYALLLRRTYRGAALRFLEEVRRSPNLVASSTAELEHRAEDDWLRRFADQDFSFTDAVSFAVMAERGIAHVLGLDHHFSTAGFVLVPSVEAG